MIFVPPTASYSNKDNSFQVITVNNDMKLGIIYLKNPNANKTIIYSHGNAEDIGNIYSLIHWYYDQGFSVLAYDYPGYGLSSGFATENNSYKAITGAYNFLIKQGVKTEDIILFGRSLGSGPSLYLAEKRDFAAVVLESPFVSAFRVITYVPLFPVDRFNNINRLKNLRSPLIIIHGEQDNIVPFWHGHKLYSNYSGKKLFFPIKNANHNDLHYVIGFESYAKIIKEIKNFISSND